MITRRDALQGTLLLMAQAALAQAQSQPATPAARVFQHELPDVNLHGWEVTVSQVDFPPGREGRPHRHAGFVLAYVLEGQIISQVSGQGPEKTFHPGEMFYEPPGSTHMVSRNASASEPAKLLALIFAPKGAKLTVPAS